MTQKPTLAPDYDEAMLNDELRNKVRRVINRVYGIPFSVIDKKFPAFLRLIAWDVFVGQLGQVPIDDYVHGVVHDACVWFDKHGAI